jgi:hypothetical protein
MRWPKSLLLLWIATGGGAAVAITTGNRLAEALGGAILVAWGGAGTMNVHGLGDKLRRQSGVSPLGEETDRVAIRVIFGGFAFFGALAVFGAYG